MLKISSLLIDALHDIGGQCAALYPEKPIYDIPAHPSLLASELIEKLKEQAAPFKPIYHLGQKVTGVAAQDGFKVTTSAGNTISCKAIVIAAGCGAFGPNR